MIHLKSQQTKPYVDKKKQKPTRKISNFLVKRNKQIIPLSARILMKTDYAVLCVRSVRRRLPALCTITVFRHHSNCGRKL